MTSCSPSRTGQGAVLVNLRETDGRQAELTLLDAAGNPLTFEVVNVLDEPLGIRTSSLTLQTLENQCSCASAADPHHI